MIKEILFTHNDLDGVGCSVIYHLARWRLVSTDESLIVYCSNAGVDTSVKTTLERDDIEENVSIIFSDICCSKELLEELVKQYSEILVFDHHQTNMYAVDILPEGRAIIIPKDENGRLKCGTSIMYDYIRKNGRSLWFLNQNEDGLLYQFQYNVEEYDTFQFKQSGNMTAKYLMILFGLLGIDRFVNKYVDKIMDEKSDKLISDDDMEFILAKIESEQRYIDNLTPDSFRYFKWNGKIYERNCAMIINPMANVGEIAFQYLQKHPEIDVIIAAILNFDAPTFQIRCYSESINTGIEFALPLGGGGHPKASGASISNELMNSIFNDICRYIEKTVRMDYGDTQI